MNAQRVVLDGDHRAVFGKRQRISADPATKIKARGAARHSARVIRGGAVPAGLLESLAQKVHLGSTGKLGERPSPQDGLLDSDARQHIGEATSEPLRNCEEGPFAGLEGLSEGQGLLTGAGNQPTERFDAQHEFGSNIWNACRIRKKWSVTVPNSR
jgi:hypothetical protein